MINKTHNELLEILEKQLFSNDSMVLKTIKTGRDKCETSLQLIERAVKCRKDSAKMKNFLNTYDIYALEKVQAEIDASSDDKVKEAEVVEVAEVVEKVNAIVDESAYDIEMRDLKFIKAIQIAFANDSMVMKAIERGDKLGETTDKIVLRIAKSRKDSNKMLNIIKEHLIVVNDDYTSFVYSDAPEPDNVVAEVKLDKTASNVVQEEEQEKTSLVQRFVKGLKSKIETVKEFVTDIGNDLDEPKVEDKLEEFNKALDVKKQESKSLLVNFIEEIKVEFETDSTMISVILQGVAKQESDQNICIRILKRRKDSAKLRRVNATYELSVFEKDKRSYLKIGKVLTKTETFEYIKHLTQQKENKTSVSLNDIVVDKLEEPVNNFKKSKDVEELKTEISSNIIKDMIDKDALSYITTELSDIFKNDTVVKKSFNVSEKYNEGLAGKILRAKKIRPANPRLKEVLSKIICNLDDIDEFMLNTKDTIRSEYDNIKDNSLDSINDKNIKYVANEKSITIYAPNGEIYSASKNHKNFVEIKKMIQLKKIKEAILLISAVAKISEKTIEINKLSGDLQVVIRDKKLYKFSKSSKAEPELISGNFADFIIDMVTTGRDTSSQLLFLSKMVSNNMDTSSVDGLYKFLKNARIPINKDGNILTYKVITSNYKDCHTKKIDNSIGITVTMERSQVTFDPRISCASGLHVCSYSYISSFRGGSDRLVICEVEPQDVVSVPVDYNFAKMRCCRYKVVEEITKSGDVLSSREDCSYLF